jgi:hypothetical protein
MIDLTKCLTHLYPNAQWTLNGDSYDGLVWLSDLPKPTQEELESVWENVLLVEENKKQEEVALKESGRAKLLALGLSEDEIKALVGA